MTPQDVLTFLRAHKAEMQEKFGATQIGLAGSYARGVADEESDIDIVVELQSANKFKSFFNLLYYLQESLGKRVDLVTESSLKQLVRKAILKDIIYV